MRNKDGRLRKKKIYCSNCKALICYNRGKRQDLPVAGSFLMFKCSCGHVTKMRGKGNQYNEPEYTVVE